MSNEEFINLSGKIADGSANISEIALYNACYETFQQDQESWEDMQLDPRKLQKESLRKFWKQAAHKPRTFPLWHRITAAASIAIFIVAGIFLYNYKGSNITHNTVLSANDIAPGSNKAYLTLGGGKKISLTDVTIGAVAAQTGVQISKSADGQLVYMADAAKQTSKAATEYNTIETPKGGQYQVRLPDGTKVWLNAASMLKFPSTFENLTQRTVELNGEAYFEVAKDKTHPFIVHSGKQNVKVLGTHFNINNYADETDVKTTLLEGSVLVYGASNSNFKSAVLKPGQQSVLKDNQIKVQQSDIESDIAWKNGFFVFKDSDLKTVMRQLSRWYDIEVEFKGDIPQSEFNGKVYRNLTLQNVLEVLSFSQVKFKIEGRKLTILP